MSIESVQNNLIIDDDAILTNFRNTNAASGGKIQEFIDSDLKLSEKIREIAVEIWTAHLERSPEVVSRIMSQSGVAQVYGTYQQTALEFYVYLKWLERKIVYNISDQMIESLITTEDTKIYYDVMRYLPSFTFYLNVSEKYGGPRYVLVEFHPSDKEDIPDAFTVASIKRCDTSPPVYMAKALVFLDGWSINDAMQEAEKYDLNQQVNADREARGLNVDEIYKEELENTKTNIHVIVSLLCYMAASNAVIKPRRIGKEKRKRKRNGKPLIFEYNDVGIYKGLHFDPVKESRMNEETTPDNTDSVGAKKMPHVRRAHWHHYWIGTGDSKRRTLKWLPPIYVNSDEFDPPKTPIVRDVPTQ